VREEGFTLKVEGLDIVGEVFIPEGLSSQGYPALIISHGIPAREPDPQDRGYPCLAERFCQAGLLVAIFNFRGCGSSGGNFEMGGWTRDLAAVIDYVAGLPGVDQERLALMGFSGGAAVSVYVGARDRRVSAVVACSCPDVFEPFYDAVATEEFLKHAREIGIIRDPGYPPSLQSWMEGFDQVAPIRWVADISPRPLLILHGEQDDLVKVEQAWRLYHQAREPKEIRIFQGAGHKLRIEEPAMEAALEWLKKVSGLGQAVRGR
jgi:dipeptidyl aminopeptidase/acylaminoacyl peptidase